MKVLSILNFGLLSGLVLSACSKSGHEKGVQVFFGECRIEVISKTEGAEILVDGVGVGEGEVSLEVPCGEKRIDVGHHGFVPYQKYFQLEKSAPLKIVVELEKSKELRNEALSSELIESLKTKVVAKAETSDMAKAAGASDAPKAATDADSDNVENWR